MTGSYLSSDDQKTSPTLIHQITSSPRDQVWVQFVNRYEPMLLCWARQMGLNEAASAEVLSDVYCKLVEHLPLFMYDPARSFRGWLHRVLQNAVKDQHRRLLRKPMVFNSELLANETDDQSIDVESEFSEALSLLVEKSQGWAMIVRQRVNEKTWNAFTRTAIDGVEARVVAAELGMSISSVYVARNRVRNALLQLASDDGEAASL